MKEVAVVESVAVVNSRSPRSASAITEPTAQELSSGHVSVPVGIVTISMETMVSPLSTSVKPQSEAAVHEAYITSSVTVTAPPLVVGKSLVLETTMSKSSLTASPLSSVHVVLTLRVPTSSFVGVPLYVLVAAVKVNQLGRGSPFVLVEVYVHESPASTSLNTSASNV